MPFVCSAEVDPPNSTNIQFFASTIPPAPSVDTSAFAPTTVAARQIAPTIPPVMRPQPLTGRPAAMWDLGRDRKLLVAFPRGTDHGLVDLVMDHANRWTTSHDPAGANVNFVQSSWTPGEGGCGGACIRIVFQDRRAAYVGYHLNILSSEPTMWLDGIDDLAPEDQRRIITHEFGHALGFLHEHQNPTAAYDWNEENVIAYANQQWGWSEARTERNILTTANPNRDVYGIHDPDSVMQYDIPADWLDSGPAGGGGTDLSEEDIAVARLMYPHPDDTATANTLEVGSETHGRFARPSVWKVYGFKAERSTYRVDLMTKDTLVDVVVSDVDGRVFGRVRDVNPSVEGELPDAEMYVWVRQVSAGNINHIITVTRVP